MSKTKSFEMSLSLKNAMVRRGRLDDYVRSHMFEYDMDNQRPYEVTEDEDRRVAVITQECDDAQDD